MSSPLHSVTAFSRNGHLIVQLTTPKGHAHEICFDMTPDGLRAFAKFLQSREIEAAKQHTPKFATKSIPIQHMIDATKLTNATRNADRERFARKPVTEQLKELEQLFENF